ncbi:MAG: hypothetical protein J6L23_06190 [Clostridia bacterium]|nr:hypothetical protein [Clostridia bacterium]
MNSSGGEYKRIVSSICNAVSGFCEFLGEQFNSSALNSAIERLGLGTRSIELRRKCVRAIEKTTVAKAYSGLVSNMLSASSRVYGTFLLTFGLYILLIFLVKRFAFSEMGEDQSDVILACGLILAGLPIFIIDRSISTLLRSSKITSYLLTKVFAVRGATLKPCEKTGVGYVASLILGLLCGSLTIFFSPLTIFLILVVVLMAMLVLASPESGVALLFMLLPFLDTLPLLFAVIIVLLSLIRKVLSLKRTLHFKAIDYTVLIFSFLVLVFGTLSFRIPDGFKNSMILLVFVLSYFAVTQLVVNNETFYCCIRSFLLGNLITSLITILQFISSIDHVPYSKYIIINFTPEYSVVMLIVIALPLMLGRMQYASSKLVAATAFLLTTAALVLCPPDSYWFVAIITFFVAVFTVSKKGFLVVLFITLASVAAGNFFLPESIRATVIDSLLQMIEPYKAYFNAPYATYTHLFEGVGYGDVSFNFSTVMLDPTTVQKPISSLSYLLSSGGVVTALSYLSILVGVIMNTMTSLHRGIKRKMKTIIKMLSCALFAMLLESTCRNYQGGNTLTLMFWLVLGLMVAGNNCLDKEDSVNSYIA